MLYIDNILSIKILSNKEQGKDIRSWTAYACCPTGRVCVGVGNFKPGFLSISHFEPRRESARGLRVPRRIAPYHYALHGIEDVGPEQFIEEIADLSLLVAGFLLSTRFRGAILVALVCDVALAAVSLDDFERARCRKKRREVLHSIVAGVDWRLPFGSATGG